jgi:hypothetical protein
VDQQHQQGHDIENRVDNAKTRDLRPGDELHISCESQKRSHRYLPIEKNFAKGTRIDEIINYFLDVIDLPQQVNIPAATLKLEGISADQIAAGLPQTGILAPQSFSGPAFPTLRRYCYDLGLYCWICDGIIHISSIYDPQDQQIIEIDLANVLLEPEETTRTDDRWVMQQTIVESTNIDPLRKKVRRKKKRRIKVRLGKGDSFYYTPTPEAPNEGDYTEYVAVDTTVYGMNFDLNMDPRINPDSLLRINSPELKNKLWRAQRVFISANNERFDEWDMQVEADAYERVEEGELL